MKSRDIIVLFLVAFLIFVSFKATPKEESPIFCTADAKICPDGTGVGRVGPNCEFAECPVVKEDTKTGLNQTILNRGLYITPLFIESDSRCPEDVQCIWAGEVRLSVRLTSGMNSEEVTFTEGSTNVFLSKKIKLISVSPPANSKKVIRLQDYIFEFSVI